MRSLLAILNAYPYKNKTLVSISLYLQTHKKIIIQKVVARKSRISKPSASDISLVPLSDYVVNADA